MKFEAWEKDPKAKRNTAIFACGVGALLFWVMWGGSVTPGRSLAGKGGDQGGGNGTGAQRGVMIPPPPGSETYGPLLGKWQGSAVLVNRALAQCTLNLELRDDGKGDGGVMGYSSLVCVPSPGAIATSCKADPNPVVCVAREQWKTSPTSAILAGGVRGNAITLDAKRNVGAAATGCVMQALSARDFGDSRIAVDWSDSCGGGQLILGRVSR
jgi:hypothetical protein